MDIKIAVDRTNPHEIVADVRVIGVYSEKDEKLTENEWIAALNHQWNGGLLDAAVREDFVGRKEQSLALTSIEEGKVVHTILHGLGSRAVFQQSDARTFGIKAASRANQLKAEQMVIGLPEGWEEHARQIGEGVALGAYRFTKYLSEAHPLQKKLKKVTLVSLASVGNKVKDQLKLGHKIGSSINISRDLANEPPNVMTPIGLAAAAKKMAKACGLKIHVFDFDEIVRRGMKLIQAVGQGSVHEPRFVHMIYKPSGKPKKKVACVGKGVTFDAGGISIKPAVGMHAMKADMSGAGNVVGLMSAVAALQLKIEVHGIMVCGENLPDGGAYRPGDIWGSLDGKTVEILNTDAEGRLLLADALAYARSLKPDLLIDNATLTGACVVALGQTCSAFYASHDQLADQFKESIRISGEQIWRMPLLEDLEEQIKSDVADIKQVGERYGGSITAALFLREFIGDVKDWIHVDLAGPAFLDRGLGGFPKGATGHGILTFLAFLESLAMKCDGATQSS
ncbi:leucyl aminopeptidase [Pajaroellobacter abortibovis]|uniref:Probable cytosol aminopeptidase n=1 Tax=Pajaroellobacter abortibovis TaxID=1882918 RepID=A0A1L6MYL6_9BACT|nr:leucyl aminopeptidase [Pajaroellobacter abortibovis]APS00559.1 hypothetical protein BCY86_07650 [Pajaroellobacter abortibovis]